MLRGRARGFDLNQHIIAQRLRGIVDDGLDIVNREFRIGLDNLGMRHAVGEQAQDVVDTKASIALPGGREYQLLREKT